MKSLNRWRGPLPWPLPALLTWSLAWALYITLQAGVGQGASPLPAAALATHALAATAMGLGAAWLCAESTWRRAFIALGFPLSMLLSTLHWHQLAGLWPGLHSAAWLLPLALLLALYPVQAWRDAPMFPTPCGGLQGLAEATALPARARLLDAGCGLGHGLEALRLACPQARMHGIERSWPLFAVAAWRCRWARVQQGDFWRLDWSGYQLVYLFQRPESMAAAWATAQAQMAPGSWLASLEFAVPGCRPDAVLNPSSDKPVWLYRVAGTGDGANDRDQAARAQSHAACADNSIKSLTRQGLSADGDQRTTPSA